jgi:peptidoglycan/LPS O-acetylase OafA/YrhL
MLNAAGDSPGANFRLGYRRWLDGLRGVAILVVMALHLRVFPGGSLGVDIFFVLSGFLITSMLVEEYQRRAGTISLKQFYLRRLLRLAPALAVLLILFAIHTLICDPPEVWNGHWRELLAVACYASNLSHWTGINVGNLGYTWSLSLEEQFYLLWPGLLYVMLRRLSRRQVLLIVCAGIIASAALRAFLFNQHRLLDTEPVDRMWLYAALDTRADALLTGCLAGLLASWNLLPSTRRYLRGITIAAGVGTAFIVYCLLTFDLASTQNYNGVFTLVALSVGVIILRLLAAPVGFAGRILESTPLVGVGRISYGLYLYHIPVFLWIEFHVQAWMPIKIVLGVSATFAAALLSYYLIERPFLRLKDRLHASAKPAVSAERTAKPPARAA